MQCDEPPGKFETCSYTSLGLLDCCVALLEGQTSDSMEECIQREMEKLRNTFSSLQDHESIERFARVWEDIGLKTEHRQERRGKLLMLNGRCKTTRVLR